jgi:hypothetical protein
MNMQKRETKENKKKMTKTNDEKNKHQPSSQ